MANQSKTDQTQQQAPPHLDSLLRVMASIWNFLPRFLGGRQNAREVARKSAPDSRSPELERLDELERLEAAIRKMLEADRARYDSRLFFVSLDSVRKRYGTTWRYVAEKAQRTARNHITQGLTPEDECIAIGDVDFLVAILAGSKREAPARVLRIDQGVSYAVTGEDLGILGVSAKQIQVAADGTLSFRPLSHADLERAEAPQTPTIDLEAELVEDEEEDESFPSIDAVLEALVFRVEPIMTLPDQPPQFERLAAYSPPLGVESDEWTIIDNFSDPKVRAKIDLKCLKACRAHLRRIVADRAGRRIVVPVFFETLANNYTRGLFLKIAQKIPQPARKSLVFQIDGVPTGVAQSRLAELGAVVKPFSSGAFIGLPPEFVGLDVLRDLTVVGIQVDVARSGAPDSLLSAAHGAGLATWVSGLRNDAERNKAMLLGATFGSGPLFPGETPTLSRDVEGEG